MSFQTRPTKPVWCVYRLKTLLWMCCRHRSNGNFTALFSHEQKTHAVLHGYKLVVGLKIIQLWKWPKCASVASPVRKSAIGVLSLIDWFISGYIRVSSSHWHKRHLTWGMSWEQEQMLLELKHNSSTRWHCASLRGHWGNPQHMCGSFRNFLQAQRYTSVPSFSHYEQAPM